MKNIFHTKINPLPWIDYQLNAVEHTNFFENRATEYAKASTTGNWTENDLTDAGKLAKNIILNWPH